MDPVYGVISETGRGSARPGVMIYFDLLPQLEDYSAEECGELFRALLIYGSTGKAPAFSDRGMRVLWRTLQARTDRDREAYQKRVSDAQYAVYCRQEKRSGGEPVSRELWELEQAGSEELASDRPASEQIVPDRPLSVDHGRCECSSPDNQLQPQLQPQPQPQLQPQPQPQRQPDPASQAKRGEEFEAFWAAYPRKVGKKQARTVFAKIREPTQTLLAALERQKRSEQWQRDDGRYVPHPATWLRQERWEDEPPGGRYRVPEFSEYLDGVEDWQCLTL